MSEEEKPELWDDETVARYLKPLPRSSRNQFVKYAGRVYENTGDKLVALQYAKSKVRPVKKG